MAKENQTSNTKKDEKKAVKNQPVNKSDSKYPATKKKGGKDNNQSFSSTLSL